MLWDLENTHFYPKSGKASTEFVQKGYCTEIDVYAHGPETTCITVLVFLILNQFACFGKIIQRCVNAEPHAIQNLHEAGSSFRLRFQNLFADSSKLSTAEVIGDWPHFLQQFWVWVIIMLMHRCKQQNESFVRTSHSSVECFQTGRYQRYGPLNRQWLRYDQFDSSTLAQKFQWMKKPFVKTPLLFTVIDSSSVSLEARVNRRI